MDAVLNLFGLLAVAALLVAGLWHVYWAAGGGIGLKSTIPEVEGKPLFEPGRFRAATLGVAFSIFGLATLYAHANGIVSLAYLPSWVFNTLLGLAGLGLGVRAIGDGRAIGFTKIITGTRFARLDTWIWSPLCLLLGFIALALAARNLL